MNYYAGESYVRYAAPACEISGCQMSKVEDTLRASAETLAEFLGRSRMSQALWCDQGGHAFSERDAGRQRISVTVLDESGQELKEARDLCGACAASSGLLAERKTRPAGLAPALAAAVPQAQPTFYPNDPQPDGAGYSTGQHWQQQ